jgi:hypothetical protein
MGVCRKATIELSGWNARYSYFDLQFVNFPKEPPLIDSSRAARGQLFPIPLALESNRRNEGHSGRDRMVALAGRAQDGGVTLWAAFLIATEATVNYTTRRPTRQL